MRVTLPLLRIPPARAPILRYGVAVLSTALALIPTILLADVSESRLALFGVAVMVSAWYGGWKPGVVATAFALTVSAYFTLVGEHSPDQLRTAILRLSLFFFVAMLICWLNAALRAAQENLRRSDPFQGLTAEWKRKTGTTVVRVSGRAVSNGRKDGVVFEMFAEDVTER